mgnify:CR=1 FL=1
MPQFGCTCVQISCCYDDNVVLQHPAARVAHCDDAAVGQGGTAVVDQVRHVAGTCGVHTELIIQLEDVRACIDYKASRAADQQACVMTPSPGFIAFLAIP